MIIASLILFAALYWRGARPGDGIAKREALAYWIGFALLAFALESPLHEAGEKYFSAHMLQHEIIMALAAPLLVLGRPLVRYLWALPLGWRRAFGGLSTPLLMLTHPLTAGVLHAGAIWIWHYPPFFEATLSSEWVHAAQHLSFFLTALLFWWSVWHRPAAPALLNLLITTVYTGVLGALLAFSRGPLYPSYELRDQQLGGLIMWVPGGVAYMVAALWIMFTVVSPQSRGRIGRGAVGAAFCLLLAGCTESRERWSDAHDLTGGDPARGALMITYYGCHSCHTIPGIQGATATVGPPLTLIARRSYLAGVLPNEVSNMEQWIRRPQQIHPGTAMPDLNVTSRDARDISAYLYTLR